MDAETILDIILGSLLGLVFLSCAILALVWRLTKFVKTIHATGVGSLAMVLSALLGILPPISGFTFMDDGQSGTKALIVAILFCPAMVAFSLREFCFCIFVDGKDAVKRVLWVETRIDLSENGAAILLGEDFGRLQIAIISSDGKKEIRFSERHVEGDVSEFLEICKQIRNEK